MLQRVEESVAVVNCIPELSLISSKTMWQQYRGDNVPSSAKFLDHGLSVWMGFPSTQKGQLAKKCLG